MNLILAAAVALSLLTTTNAFAQTAAPAPQLTPVSAPVALPASEQVQEDDSVIKDVPANMQDRWSWHVSLQGAAQQAGVGFAVETPFAWDFIALRLGLSSERLHFANVVAADFDYSALDVALKFQGEISTSTNMYPYTMLMYRSFLVGDDDSVGSKNSFGVIFGADWRFVGTPRFARDQRIVRSFFVEAGVMDSNFGPDYIPSAKVDDGFVARVGIRQYF